jgi:L-ascorbate metabolism protein UlaG (beta-lactamase superfamily)
MELTWIGGSNSWFCIKAGGKVLHIDPSYSPRGHVRGPEMAEKADLIPEMGQLGHVDVALLPIGGTFTMDVDAATEAAKIIRAAWVVPMHNLRTPIDELRTRLGTQTEVQTILAEQGKPFVLF